MSRVKDDISAISGYAEQYAPQLILQAVQSMTVLEDVEVIYNLSSTRHLPKYVANEGFRPEDTGIEEQDGAAGQFSKRSITPQVGMKILEIVPADFRRTYMSDLVKPNSKDLPFAQAFWTAQMEKLAAEIDQNHYFGENSDLIPMYVAANTYPAGARVKASNKNFYIATANVLANELPGVSAKWAKANNSSIVKGFGTIIEQDINQFPAQNKIATGQLTEDDAHDQFIEMYEAQSEIRKAFGGVYYCSPNSWNKYVKSTLKKYPGLEGINASRGNVSKFIYGSDDKWQIKPVQWMAGSGRIIGTPDPKRVKNLYMGTNVLGDFSSIGKVVETLHGNKSILKASLAFQIADTEITQINDVR